MSVVIHTVSDANDLYRLVQDNKLVVADFYAAWCGPCHMIGPKFKSFAEKYPTVTFVAVDVDEAEDAAEAAGVSAMPTFCFYKDGKVAERIEGASEKKLGEVLDQLTKE